MNTAGAGCLSGVGRVDVLPEVGILEIPTKAWPLLPHLAAARAWGWSWRRYSGSARVHLYGAADRRLCRACFAWKHHHDRNRHHATKGSRLHLQILQPHTHTQREGEGEGEAEASSLFGPFRLEFLTCIDGGLRGQRVKRAIEVGPGNMVFVKSLNALKELYICAKIIIGFMKKLVSISVNQFN